MKSASNLLVIIISFITLSVCAQNHQIQGKVFDEHGNPFGFANVVLLCLPDSTFAQGTSTDIEGNFTFSEVSLPQKICLKVSSIGYATKVVSLEEVDSIALFPASMALNEVVVSAIRKRVQQKEGKLICNVEGTLLSAETHLADLLGKLPGFYMQAGELKTMSKGEIQYLIDNRPVSEENIKNLDVKKIKSIELDRHPGARYSNQIGTVVNIRTHRPQSGFTTLAKSTTQLNHKLSQNTDVELSYQYKKFRLTFREDFYLEQAKTYQELGTESTNSDLLWKISSRDDRQLDRSHGNIFSVAMDYNFNTNHDIHLSFYKNLGKDKVLYDGVFSLTDETGTKQETLYSIFNNKSARDHLNFYYTIALSDFWTFEVSVDWYLRNKRKKQELFEQKRTINTTSDANSYLLGCSPMAKFHKGQNNLQFGIDFSKSVVDYTTNLNITDILSSKQRIKELKKDVYAEYKFANKSQKMMISLGIRYENVTENFYDFLTTSNSLKLTYHNFSPSILFSFSGKKLEQSFSYSSFREHPTFSQIAGGETFVNSYEYKCSNPNLKRPIRHDFSYDLTYKWLNLAFGYSYTSSPIYDIPELEYFSGHYRSKLMPKNLNYIHEFSSVLYLSPVFGCYEPRFMIGFFKDFLSVPENDGSSSKLSSALGMKTMISNTFNMKNNWSWGINLWYGKGGQGPIEFSASSSCDLFLQKLLLKNTLQIDLKITDITDSSTPRINCKINNVNLSSYAWLDRRSVRLNVIWRFNKHKDNPKHSSISNEINRL